MVYPKTVPSCTRLYGGAPFLHLRPCIGSAQSFTHGLGRYADLRKCRNSLEHHVVCAFDAPVESPYYVAFDRRRLEESTLLLGQIARAAIWYFGGAILYGGTGAGRTLDPSRTESYQRDSGKGSAHVMRTGEAKAPGPIFCTSGSERVYIITWGCGTGFQGLKGHVMCLTSLGTKSRPGQGYVANPFHWRLPWWGSFDSPSRHREEVLAYAGTGLG